MVVHVLADVSQEARSNDADRAKRDAHVVDVLVRFSVSNLAGRNHQFVCTRNTADAGNGIELFEEGRAGQLDGFFDQQWVGDVEFVRHCAADVCDSCHLELGDEDVVAVSMLVVCKIWLEVRSNLLHAVTNRSTDDTDGESESCDGGD
jgi:hypothetical protein